MKAAASTLFASLLAVGCLAGDADLPEGDSVELGEQLGDADQAELGDAEDLVAPDFASDRPCGDGTQEMIRTESGNYVFLCRFADDSTAVVELGEIGKPSVLPARLRCAADAIRAIDPDREIPAVYKAACAEPEKLQVDLGPDIEPVALSTSAEGFDPAELPPADPVVPEAHYCGSNGAQEFKDERCYSSGSSVICQTNLVNWHQRTCSASVGDWCRYAIGVIASCGGPTRFRAWAGKSLENLKLDTTVHANYWQSFSMWAPNKPVLFGWKDSDFRFRGDSYSGASHRYSNRFLKN